MPAALEPTVDVVSVERVRKGEPAIEDLAVQYRPGTGLVRASLIILSEWRKRSLSYRRADFYHVEPVPAGAGKAFRLWRERRKVEADPVHTPSYSVIIDGLNSQCDCWGYASASRDGRECKHVCVLRRLVEVGAV